MPDRVLTLYEFYRMGQAARSNPWDWQRPAGTREMAHQYPVSFSGSPEERARCGRAPDPTVTEWERTGGKYPCSACRAQDEGGAQHTNESGRIRLVAMQE